MDEIKRISTIGTAICLISLVIYAMFVLLIHFEMFDVVLDFVENSMNKIGQVDSNSPSAGFEVLAYLSGGGLGFIGSLFMVLFEIFLGFMALYQVPAIVSGFMANVRYKKGDAWSACIKSYKIDGLIKAIMSGIVLLVVLLMMLGEMGRASIWDDIILLSLVWNYIAVFIISVIQIKNIQNEVKE